MFYYREADTEVRPMPLEVSSEVFASEWRACWEDSTRDLTALYKIMIPWFDYWERVLTTTDGYEDIQFISFCHLIHSTNPGKALERIKLWVEDRERFLSIREELELVFLEHVRNCHYYPSYATPIMAEWVISKEYKIRLRDKIIRRVNLKCFPCRELLGVKPLEEPSYVPTYRDVLLLEKVQEVADTKWLKYLLLLIFQYKDCMEIERLTHIIRGSSQQDREKLWNTLERLHLGQEI